MRFSKKKYFNNFIETIKQIDFGLIMALAIFLDVLIISFFSFLISDTSSTGSLNSSIITQSLTFIGTLLALLFTLIILPTQKILGKYSQDMVNNIILDKTFTNTLYFFLGLFLIDFLILAIFPSEKNVFSYILLLTSLSGTTISITILYKFIMKVFYLLDIRNQMQDLSVEAKIYLEDKNYEKGIEKIDIIADIIQNTLNRFEVVVAGFIQIKDLTTYYIESGKKDKNKFIIHIYRIFKRSSSALSQNPHIKSIIELISSIMVICEAILGKEDLTKNAPLFIQLLEEITYSNETEEDMSYISEDVSKKLLKLGKLAINQKKSRILRNILHALGKMGRELKTPTKRSYSNVQVIFLFNHCLKKINKKNPFKSEIFNDLNAILNEIAENVNLALEKNITGCPTKDVRIILQPTQKKGIVYSFYQCILKINENGINSPQAIKLQELSESVLKQFQRFIETSCSHKNRTINYFDIRTILESIYKISINLIYEIKNGTPEHSAFFQKIFENVLNIFSYLISESMSNYKDLKYNIKYYLTIFTLLISLMIVNNKTNKFTGLIDEWLKKILEIYESTYNNYNEYKEKYEKLDVTYSSKGLLNFKKKLDDYKESIIVLQQYLRVIGAMIYENKVMSTEIDNLKVVLQEFDRSIGSMELYPSTWSYPIFDEMPLKIKKGMEKSVYKLNDFNFDAFENDYLREE